MEDGRSANDILIDQRDTDNPALIAGKSEQLRAGLKSGWECVQELGDGEGSHVLGETPCSGL